MNRSGNPRATRNPTGALPRRIGGEWTTRDV
jgi:hypothetical protein